MTINIEEMLEKFKRDYLNSIEYEYKQIDTRMQSEIRKYSLRMEEAFKENRYSIRKIDEKIYESMYEVIKNALKSEMEKIQENFLFSYKSLLKGTDDVLSASLTDEDLKVELRKNLGKFDNLFTIQNPVSIKGASEEYVDRISRVLDFRENMDMMYAARVITQRSIDNIMNDFGDTFKHLKNSSISTLSTINEDIRKSVKSKEEKKSEEEKTNSEVERVDASVPFALGTIETIGKSEEDLLKEQREAEDKVMMDPSLSFEEKLARHYEVVNAYKVAIDGMGKRTTSEITPEALERMTIIDIKKAKSEAMSAINKDRSLDLMDALNEIDRVNKLFGEYEKSVSPIDVTTLKDKTQEELAFEKEQAIKRLVEDPNMTVAEKNQMYDRMVAQYDDAISHSPTNLEKQLAAII